MEGRGRGGQRRRLSAVRDIASGYVWSFALAAAIQLASAGIILIRRL